MSEHHNGPFDLYQAVTNAIVSTLEAGAGIAECPWHRHGTGALPTNAATNRPYRGVNVVALWASAAMAHYTSNLWATYRQWQQLGAQVRRGEHASMIVFYKEHVSEEDNPETGERHLITRLVARASRVFNVDQVEGFSAPEAPPRDPVLRIAAAEEFVRRTGARIHHEGDSAYYTPVSDYIYMPSAEEFIGTATWSPTESYYGVLLHELIHWTGAAHRLRRDLSGRFGDNAYAMEELIAELGAAFLCAQLSITPMPRPDHAAYIGNWLRVLKSDKRAIFTAASKAADAAEYLTYL